MLVKRIGPFEQMINHIDHSIPMNVKGTRKVAVVGAGIAGMSAVIVLAERGFEVDVYERDGFLGGKVGSWPHQFTPEFNSNVEHGFHAFFRQYYNLRRILGKVAADKNLIPIDDYLILTQKYGQFSFKGINTVPILNLLSLMKTGIYSFKDILLHLKIGPMMDLLAYDRKHTHEKYDHITYEEFAKSAGLPEQMRLMFTTFSRAFFAEPHLISMAELIKSFHFYFLSNDHGLIYDVLDDDFDISLWQPVTRYLKNLKTNIYLNKPVDQIKKTNSGFKVNGKNYDYVVMGSDIGGTQKIISQSSQLSDEYPDFARQIKEQKRSQKYAVLRLWIDKNTDRELPFFNFTDAVEILDSVTIYHQMEKSSKAWVDQNGGGIFELHSYALPDGWDDPPAIREQFLKEFNLYFPELKDFKIRHEYLQVRDDFTAFHTGLYKNRPTPVTGVDGLYLCGDWIKLPVPGMLMEAATTSALLGVNDILNKEKLQEEPVFSVPQRGIFA